jgi:CheY-like chemotaxis protein
LLETIGRTGMVGEAAAEPAEAGATPLRILVAEDNPINQTVATRLLERLGHRADTADDGREAIARLEEESYDVVLMDVQMPVMDGLEASRAICARWPIGRRPRIVALTAEAMAGDREKCLRAGMDDYMVKPVTLERLSSVLARCRPVSGPSETEPATGAEPVADEPADVVDGAIDRRVLDQLREDLGGAAPVGEVIATFLEKTPAILAELRDAAAQSDGERIRQAAHTIKGTSATLGARRLAERCAELERMGRAGDVAGAAERVTAVEVAYRSVEAALAAAIPDGRGREKVGTPPLKH